MTRQIRRSLIRRSIDMLTDLANQEPEADKEADPSVMPAGDYMSFWESFGKMIKLGCIEDQDNKYAPCYCFLVHQHALCNSAARAALPP